MRGVCRTLGILAVTMALASPTRAESIVLTSGAFDWVSGGGAADVTMAGAGFSFEGNAHTTTGIFGPWLQCLLPSGHQALAQRHLSFPNGQATGSIELQ